MNVAKRTATAPSPSNDATRIIHDNISYPDLRILGSERVSSESSRSGGQSTNTRIEDLLAQLKVENQIKRGAENMLQVFDEQKAGSTQGGKAEQVQLQKLVESRQQQVESQLDATNAKIHMLRSQLQELGVARSSLDSDSTSFVNKKQSSDFMNSIEQIDELETERRSQSSSPTWSLGDILQSLEEPSHTPEYLIGRANDLVSLLQRHSVLKYDLVMSKFADRYVEFLVDACSNNVESACYFYTKNQRLTLPGIAWRVML